MLIAPRLGLRLHDEAMHLCDSCSNAPQFSPDMTQPVWFSTVARISDEPLPGVAIMKMQRDAASCAVSKAWMIIKGRWDLLDVWRLARESSEGVSAVQLQDCREVSGACCRTAGRLSQGHYRHPFLVNARNTLRSSLCESTERTHTSGYAHAEGQRHNAARSTCVRLPSAHALLGARRRHGG